MLAFPDFLVFDYISAAVNSGLLLLFPAEGGLSHFFSQPVSSFMLTLEQIFLAIPWLFYILAAFLGGYILSRRYSTGALFAAMMLLVGGLGLWEPAIITLSVVFGALLISLFMGSAAGVLMASSGRLRRMLHPFLDFIGMFPPILYVAASAIFFGLGEANALVATSLCTIPTVMRTTCLAITGVDFELRETGMAMGATKWQSLFKIEIPLALPTLLGCVHRAVLMSLSMAVLCSFLGGRGLGSELYTSLLASNPGRSLEVCLAVAILAIILGQATLAIPHLFKAAEEEGEDDDDAPLRKSKREEIL